MHLVPSMVGTVSDELCGGQGLLGYSLQKGFYSNSASHVCHFLEDDAPVECDA